MVRAWSPASADPAYNSAIKTNNNFGTALQSFRSTSAQLYTAPQRPLNLGGQGRAKHHSLI